MFDTVPLWKPALAFCKEERPVHQVSKLSISGALDVVFIRADRPMLVVAAETPEALASVSTDLDGHSLRITREGVNDIVGSDQGIHVTGSGNRVAGSNFFPWSKAKTKPGASGRVIVGLALPLAPTSRASGSVNVAMVGVAQQGLTLKASGSVSIDLSGAVDMLTFMVSGSASIKAKSLSALTLVAEMSGSSSLTAYASVGVKVEVSGSGSCKIFGNPAQRTTKVSGSASIKFPTT